MTSEIVGADEVVEVASDLVEVVVVEALDGCVLDRAVPLPGNGLPANHERDAFNLAIRPGMLDLGQPMVDLMLAADAVEEVLEGVNVPVVVGELDAIVSKHDVEPLRHGGDQISQERGGGRFPGLLVQRDVSELGGAVPSRAFSMPCQATGGHEQVELAFRSLNLCNINMEVTERVGLELPVGGLVAPDFGEARDVVTLQTAV